MRHERDIRLLALPQGTLHRIADGRGQQITVTKGVLWVTQANDARDILLARGQSFIIDRQGLTVALALRDAAIVIGPAGHVTAADFAGYPQAA
jgi:hypothetical protein